MAPHHRFVEVGVELFSLGRDFFYAQVFQGFYKLLLDAGHPVHHALHIHGLLCCGFRPFKVVQNLQELVDHADGHIGSQFFPFCCIATAEVIKICLQAQQTVFRFCCFFLFGLQQGRRSHKLCFHIFQRFFGCFVLLRFLSSISCCSFSLSGSRSFRLFRCVSGGYVFFSRRILIQVNLFPVLFLILYPVKQCRSSFWNLSISNYCNFCSNSWKISVLTGLKLTSVPAGSFPGTYADNSSPR